MAVDDQYTKTLLHFNGSDTSTTFTDETGKVWSRGGTAQLDTGQYKFGGSSLLLDGDSDYISTPDHEDFNVGSGDFTIDMWIKRASDSPTMIEILCGQSLSSKTNQRWLFYIRNGTLAFLVYNVSGYIISYVHGSTGTPLANTNWNHVCVERIGTSAGCIHLWVNGSELALTINNDIGSYAVTNFSYPFVIGRSDSTSEQYYYSGWIDEFRFSKGIARWTENFIPQSCQYLTGNYIHARRDRMNMNPVSTQNQIT